MKQQYKYSAFISYKHEDDKWARWLQRRLEGYRLPTAIQKDNPQLPKKLLPNFKDTTDIQPNPLEDEISANLRRSRYLIVVSSPRSAKSHWVGFEINAFIEMGRGKDNAQGDYPKALEFYTKAYNVLHDTLGADHPNTRLAKKISTLSTKKYPHPLIMLLPKSI